jgi:hypothetical protein
LEDWDDGVWEKNKQLNTSPKAKGQKPIAKKLETLE